MRNVPDVDGLPWAIGVARWQVSNARRGSRRRHRLAAKIAVLDDPTRDPVDPHRSGCIVTSIDDGIVTLRTTHVFRGEMAGTVTVQQGGEAPIDGAPVRFSAGTTYLIAAGPDGVVGGCSGPTTPDLRTMFDQAFAG